jgi:hypothetical protein
MMKHLMLALALMAALPAITAEPPQRPYSCQLFDDEQHKCSFGSCDKRTVERLRNECLRDRGRA